MTTESNKAVAQARQHLFDALWYDTPGTPRQDDDNIGARIRAFEAAIRENERAALRASSLLQPQSDSDLRHQPASNDAINREPLREALSRIESNPFWTCQCNARADAGDEQWAERSTWPPSEAHDLRCPVFIAGEALHQKQSEPSDEEWARSSPADAGDPNLALDKAIVPIQDEHAMS